MRPGISSSARRISLRPHSASARSATLNGDRPALVARSKGWAVSVAVVISGSLVISALVRGSGPAYARRGQTPYLCSRSRRYEKPRAFRGGVFRHCVNLHVRKSRVRQQAAHVFVGKPEPHVAHLLAVVFAFVREH